MNNSMVTRSFYFIEWEKNRSRRSPCARVLARRASCHLQQWLQVENEKKNFFFFVWCKCVMYECVIRRNLPPLKLTWSSLLFRSSPPGLVWSGLAASPFSCQRLNQKRMKSARAKTKERNLSDPLPVRWHKSSKCIHKLTQQIKHRDREKHWNKRPAESFTRLDIKFTRAECKRWVRWESHLISWIFFFPLLSSFKIDISCERSEFIRSISFSSLTLWLTHLNALQSFNWVCVCVCVCLEDEYHQFQCSMHTHEHVYHVNVQTHHCYMTRSNIISSHSASRIHFFFIFSCSCVRVWVPSQSAHKCDTKPLEMHVKVTVTRYTDDRCQAALLSCYSIKCILFAVHMHVHLVLCWG